MKFFFFILAISSSALAQELPGPPSSPDHPGSKIYSYTVERRDVRCDGRDVAVFYPREISAKELPLLVYGHGQALGVEHYEQTLRHLAAALDVADLDVSGGHIDDAFERLLSLFARADKDARETIRTRLVQLFEVVGVTDPRVIAGRAKLSALLY